MSLLAFLARQDAYRRSTYFLLPSREAGEVVTGQASSLPCALGSAFLGLFVLMELVLLNSELTICIAYIRVKSQVESEASDLLQHVWH